MTMHGKDASSNAAKLTLAKLPAEDAPKPVPLLDINRHNAPLREQTLAAITEVCDTGAFLKGPACRDLEAEVAKLCGTEHAIGCASGSDAILIPLMALDIGPGDEVILPSFTFFATAGSVVRLGAKPVFADILPDTFNIDPADVARKITPRTKAILPVHLFGQAADMPALLEIGDEHGIPVIEDAAQAIGATCDGTPIGGIGLAGCISFYPTKNLGGFGDGGMITTNNTDLAEKIRVLCDHGQSPRYHHSLVGLNSRLDTIQAAVLSVKLKHLAEYASSRTVHAKRYEEAFTTGVAAGVVEVPREAHGCPSVWNQYTVRVPGGRRDVLQKYLGDRKVGAAIYYPIPLHLQDCFASEGYKRGDLPHTERAAEEVLSLPVFPEMYPEEQDRVIEVVNQFAAEVTSTGRMAA